MWLSQNTLKKTSIKSILNKNTIKCTLRVHLTTYLKNISNIKIVFWKKSHLIKFRKHLQKNLNITYNTLWKNTLFIIIPKTLLKKLLDRKVLLEN